MRFIVISAFLFGLLPMPVRVHGLGAQQAEPSSHVTTDEAAIQDLISRLVAASNANDVKAFAKVFAEDADFTNVIGQHVKGRTSIEEFHAPYYSGPRQPGRPSFIHARLTAVESKIRFLRPDVAAVDIKWQQIGAISPEGRPWGPRTGLMNWVVTRERGVWGIAVMHNLQLTPSSSR
jgi:uncharacterized protein (TIGR02246 family)